MAAEKHFWEELPRDGQLITVQRGTGAPTIARWRRPDLILPDLTTENVRGGDSWTPYEGALVPARGQVRKAKRQP